MKENTTRGREILRRPQKGEHKVRPHGAEKAMRDGT